MQKQKVERDTIEKFRIRRPDMTVTEGPDVTVPSTNSQNQAIRFVHLPPVGSIVGSDWYIYSLTLYTQYNTRL